MKKFLDYIFSVIFLIAFILVLFIFQPIQWVIYTLFGNKGHQKVVEYLGLSIISTWYLTGSTTHFSQEEQLPHGRPIIFIANHQSMFDIPGIIWYWRRYTPLFVAKKELAKGIPSISYNLRVGKAALIDRKDGRAAVVEIAKLAKYVKQNNFSAVIFPEGTRSLNGRLKAFKPGGVAALLKKCPNALIVPLAIKNTGIFNPKGVFPIRPFTSMKFRSLKSFEPAGLDAQTVADKAKAQIQAHLFPNESEKSLV